jgi:hypothetical protein
MIDYARPVVLKTILCKLPLIVGTKDSAMFHLGLYLVRDV